MTELHESFHVERALSAVWERLQLPGDCPSGTCRIPGFPSVDGQPGCHARIEVNEAQKTLGCTKLDHPCAGTAITIDIGSANASGWPTRVSVVQSGFQPPLADMPDFLNAHRRQIVADFRLYLEHGVAAEQSAWRTSLGALTRETAVGLTVTSIEPDGFASRCGMREGDLLLNLGGVRVLDTAQLWTVLSMLNPGDTTAAVWVSKGDILDAARELGGH